MHASRRLSATALVVLLPVMLSLGSAPGSASDEAGPVSAPATSVTVDSQQRVRLQALPQIVQPSRRVATPDTARAAITATIKPVRVGRRVMLQVQRDSLWTWVATARQDAAGRAQFAALAVRDGQPRTYRVLVEGFQGLEEIISDSVTTAPWLTPTWTDEFSGTTLSPAWNHRGVVYEPNSLRRCSRASPEAVRVGHGALRLSVIKDRSRRARCKVRVNGKVVGRFAYRLNGHVGTQGGFAFKYGVAAARVKFHRSRGQHGAFWMQPVGGNHPGSAGHEIDIIEYFGDGHPLGGLTSFIHRYDDGREVRLGARVDAGAFLANKRDGWSKGFHVFSVEWTPQMLIFRIDGKETARIRGGISSDRQYPILSLLSSDYELPKMKGKKLPQHMYVDWIRVWETGS